MRTVKAAAVQLSPVLYSREGTVAKVTVPSPATNAISESCKEAGVVVSIGINERYGVMRVEK